MIARILPASCSVSWGEWSGVSGVGVGGFCWDLFVEEVCIEITSRQAFRAVSGCLDWVRSTSLKAATGA